MPAIGKKRKYSFKIWSTPHYNMDDYSVDWCGFIDDFIIVDSDDGLAR